MGTDPKETKYFYHKVIGYKYKISNIQAALINSQLKKINSIKIKKKFFKHIKNYFRKIFSNESKFKEFNTCILDVHIKY